MSQKGAKGQNFKESGVQVNADLNVFLFFDKN